MRVAGEGGRAPPRPSTICPASLSVLIIEARLFWPYECVPEPRGDATTFPLHRGGQMVGTNRSRAEVAHGRGACAPCSCPLGGAQE